MKPGNGIRAIAIVAALGSQMLNSAQAASHLEAPLTAYHDVEFEGRGFEYDSAGNLVSVTRLSFNTTTADGRVLEGSGALSLPAQPAGGDAAPRGIIDDILGRVADGTDGSMPPFTGWAVVIFDTISVDGANFTASGELRLRAEFLEFPADELNVQIDEVVAIEAQRTTDGKISGLAKLRFSGVGRRNGVAVTVAGSAEFQFQGDTVEGVDWFAAGGWVGSQSDLANAFQGDAVEGVDWFLAGGEWRILNATLADAATGGALLFEELAGSVGAARILGAIDPAGQVDLAGALGQVTALDW